MIGDDISFRMNDKPASQRIGRNLPNVSEVELLPEWIIAEWINPPADHLRGRDVDDRIFRILEDLNGDGSTQVDAAGILRPCRAHANQPNQSHCCNLHIAIP